SRSSRATSASLLAISGGSVFEVRAIATSVSEAGGKNFSTSYQHRPFPTTPITRHDSPFAPESLAFFDY
ncbi:MAG: hypothetical protein WCO86_20425, partial [Planctomycetota bacterium]